MPPLTLPGPSLGPLGFARGGRAMPPAGYNAWYAADRITGLVSDDPLGTWTDGSGNGYDMTQGTAGKKPTYKTAVQNGLPAVLFTRASSQVLSNASGLGMGATAFSLYAVCKLASTSLNQAVMSAGQDNAPASGYALGCRSSGVWMAVKNGTAVFNGGTADTSAGTLALVFGSGSGQLYRNGSASGSAFSTTFTAPATSSSLGSDGDAAGEDFWGGYVMEALFYPTAHDSTARGAVEAYLNGKWALY